jgi:hypothetical protein
MGEMGKGKRGILNLGLRIVKWELGIVNRKWLMAEFKSVRHALAPSIQGKAP